MIWAELIEVRPGGSRPWYMTWGHHAALCRVAAQVTCRTRARMYLNCQRGELVFGYRRRTGRVVLIGLIDLPMYRNRNGRRAPNIFDPVLDVLSVDDAVWAIQLGWVAEKWKDRWAAQVAARKVLDAERELERVIEDRRPELRSRIAFLTKRHGMSRAHYRPTVLVDGQRRRR